MQDQSPPIGELIRQARDGQADAVNRLLQRYRGFVQLIVRCRFRGQLKARVDSSDVVQETLLRAAQNIDQCDGTDGEHWEAWLRRIAEREVIHQLRHHLGAEKRAIDRERSLVLPGSQTGSRLDQWLVKTRSTPSLVLARKERAIMLSDALARLPEDYREVLILRHLEELNFPEVAQRMNRSAGAVRVLWVRALKKLRDEVTQMAGISMNLHSEKA